MSAGVSLAALAMLLSASPTFAQCIYRTDPCPCPAPAGVAGAQSGTTGAQSGVTGPTQAQTQAQATPDLSELAGGGAGGGMASALPSIQGDTTWGGGRFSVLTVGTLTSGALLPVGADVNRTALSQAIPGIKRADFILAMNSTGPDGNGYYTAGSGVALASPILGYDMVNWAENASIIPQDRVFYDYRHFDKVGYITVFGTRNGTYYEQWSKDFNVDRHTMGFERMLGETSSFEVRLPFHYQINARSTLQFVGAGPSDLGITGDELAVANIGLAFKKLLVSRECVQVSAGIGLQLPTEADTFFQYVDSVSTTATTRTYKNVYLTQTNETVWINPFLGIAYTPNDRVFTQTLAQLDVPLNESHGYVSFDSQVYHTNTSTWDARQYQNQNMGVNFNSILRLNQQFGYWLRNDDCMRLNKIGALVEVDINSQLGTGDNLETIVNLGPMLVGQMGKTEGAIGMLVPVTSDTSYDWELAVRINRKF